MFVFYITSVKGVQMLLDDLSQILAINNRLIAYYHRVRILCADLNLVLDMRQNMKKQGEITQEHV